MPRPVFRSRAAAPIAAIVALAAMLAAAFAPAPSAAKSSHADIRPALWSVSDADTTIYLFGSVHVLRPQDKWRFPAFRRALARSEIVYFEAPTDLFSQASVALLIAQLGLNPPDTTLSSRLSPVGQARLSRIAESYGVPKRSLEPLRPWYAFLTLSMAAAAKAGASPTYGVDAVVEAEARLAGKEVRNFETLEQQLRIFADLDPEDEEALLEMSLKDFEERPLQFDELIAAWRNGDLAALEDASLTPLKSAPPVFFRRIYADRNRAWAETLDALLQKRPGEILVVVGAAHLVGDLAVQTLLEEKGYFISRR